jgi:TrmH family RNA methyltransferase
MNASASFAQASLAGRHNPRVKDLRRSLALGVKTARNQIAIEGLLLLGEAVRSGLRIDAVFLQSSFDSPLGELPLAGVEILRLPDEVFRGAVATAHPQGIAALVRAPDWPQEMLFRGAPLVVVAGALQDPGNLGTLVRSAEAFGATGMIALPGTVSPWNAKALRASSGSAFRLPIFPLTAEEAFALLRGRGLRIFAASPRSSPMERAAAPDLTQPAALLLGNEGAGLPDCWTALADAPVTIPCPGPVESLNAAIAGSILLYEAARQRRDRDRVAR